MPKPTLIAIIAIATLALLSPYIVLFGTMIYDGANEYMHREPFDSRVWQDPKQVEGDDPVRLRMVDDLVRSKRLDYLRRLASRRCWEILPQPNIFAITTLYIGSGLSAVG